MGCKENMVQENDSKIWNKRSGWDNGLMASCKYREPFFYRSRLLEKELWYGQKTDSWSRSICGRRKWEDSGIYWFNRYLYSRGLCKGNGTIKRDRNRTASHRYEAKGSIES